MMMMPGGSACYRGLADRRSDLFVVRVARFAAKGLVHKLGGAVQVGVALGVGQAEVAYDGFSVELPLRE